MMKLFCSWCGQSMGEKPGLAGTTSHGLCSRCASQLNADLDQMDAAQQIAVLMVERRIENAARLRRLAVALVLALFVAAPLAAQDRVGPAPYLVLTIGNSLDLATTLHGISSGRAKEGNPLWTSAGTAGFVAIKTGSALAMGLAMRQLATHGHPRAAKVLGYVSGFALVGVGVHNARVARR